MKKLIGILALLSFGLTGAAQATTFGFADQGSPFISSAHGFNMSGSSGTGSWVNGTAVPLSSGLAAPLGYAWSNGSADLTMSLATPGTFTFNSVSLFEHNIVPVTINAYTGGVLQDSYTANLTQGVYTTYTLNWSGIDEITFSNNHTGNLSLTDFTVNNAVPEPASLALIGLGALAFAATRRRSKQA